MKTKKVGIVAFAFGSPSRIASNEEISLVAFCKAIEFNALVYAHPDVEMGIMTGVTYYRETLGQLILALRFARAAALWAKKNELTGLLIICAEPHAWRCQRDLEQALMEMGLDIPVKICEDVYQIPEEKWFCEKSTQWWTRSWLNWWFRELILKYMPFWIYKRVAS